MKDSKDKLEQDALQALLQPEEASGKKTGVVPLTNIERILLILGLIILAGALLLHTLPKLSRPVTVEYTASVLASEAAATSDDTTVTDNTASSDSASEAESAVSTAVTASQIININTATAEELDLLPGIGPTKAAAIVEYREEYGPFTSVEELTEVSGIGDKTLEKLRDQITVE